MRKWNSSGRPLARGGAGGAAGAVGAAGGDPLLAASIPFSGDPLLAGRLPTQLLFSGEGTYASPWRCAVSDEFDPEGLPAAVVQRAVSVPSRRGTHGGGLNSSFF